MNKLSRLPRHKRTRRDREGVVLLVTAFVLMVVSATAVYAVQQGAFEVRAAGASRQAMRTKYVAESFVMAGLACIESDNSTACLVANPGSDPWRDKYGIPPRDTTAQPELIYEIRRQEIADHFAAEVAPSDEDLSGGGFVSAYTPGYSLIIEEWPLEPVSATFPKGSKRYIASCYGELGITGDLSAIDETRGIHESISISRAYYTKR
jgi:hypothetical protein